MKKERESNFELLRIISMIMIIMWHLLLQANILNYSNGILKLLLTIIEATIVVHVNSYVLTTGYFQYKSDVKKNKIINIIGDVWFYKVIILSIVLIFGLQQLSKLDILLNLSPINHKEYWFMNCYLILYLISPILNKIISNSDKNEMKKIILIIFIIVSILSTVSNQLIFNNEYGYSVSNFILLYFIGAYINKYNINLNTKDIIKYLLLLIGINVLLNYIGSYLLNKNSLSNYFGTIITSSSFVYDNPIVIIQSILYFLIFKNLKIKNKYINIISKTTIGVYLIHTNKLLREYVYKYFGYSKIFNNKLLVIPLLILNSLLLFIICSIIEFFRIKIKELIINSSLYIKFKEYIKNKIKKLKEEGNEKDKYELLDIFKFIFSICIVVLHIEVLNEFPNSINWYVTRLLFRLAVPFFFVSSGFLYGNKILNQNYKLKEITKNYIKRLSIPFIFWLAIGLIPELVSKYTGSLLHRCKELFLYSIFYPYGALWYIYALIFAIFILYFFYKKGKYLLPIILGYILYIFALLCNSYYFIIEKSTYIKKIVDKYMEICISPRNGLFVGILFVSLGVYISKIIKENKIKKMSYIYLMNILFFLILIIEVYYIRGKTTIDDSGLFFILPLLSSTFVLILIKLSRNKQHKFLRNFSTCIYFIHRPIIAYLLMFFTIESKKTLFIIAFPLSIIITMILLKLDNKFIKKVIS